MGVENFVSGRVVERRPTRHYFNKIATQQPFGADQNGAVIRNLRVRAQSFTARRLAEALEGHEALSRVIYPGLDSHPQSDLAARQMGAGGTMLAIEVKGGKEAAYRFLNACKIAIISNNLGDAKTILTPPAFTTHQRLPQDQKDALGITPGLVRISVGLEDADDLLSDFMQALSH